MNLDLPEALHEVCTRLEGAGHRSWLVGAALHARLVGAERPAWALATDARADDIAACFEHAVQVRPAGAAFIVPSAVGPIDIQPLRNGNRIEDDLAHRDITLFSMAWAPGSQTLVDPHGGLADLEAGVLRATGDARARLAEDPVRLLRVARLVAQFGYAVDPDLERAMTEHDPSAFDGVAEMRIRRELSLLMLGAHVAAGLELLRRTDALGPRLRAPVDAAEVVGQLPARPALRWAAWLRHSGAGRALRWIRAPRELAEPVLEMLALHPLDDHAPHARKAALRRIRKRLSAERLADLIALRRAEIEVLARASDPEAEPARARLTQMLEVLDVLAREEARERARPKLAIDGQTLMAHFGWPAGPGIGRALRYLEGRVAEDAQHNEPAKLLELLAQGFDPEAR